MKKILMVDSCEAESTVGDSEDTLDEHAGGDSSKSNSINSEHSLHSVGISAASSQVHEFIQKQNSIFSLTFIYRRAHLATQYHRELINNIKASFHETLQDIEIQSCHRLVCI